MRCLLFLFAFSLPVVVHAQPSSQEQQSLAKSLGEKVQRFEKWTDDAGNVTGLIFINHQALTKSVGVKPGIPDAGLLKLTQFPKLTAVNFEAQPIGDAGLKVLWLKPRQGVTADQLASLRSFQSLRIFSPQSFKYVVPFKAGWEVLIELPHLKRLEIADFARKQNAAAIDRLEQQLPQLQVESRLTRSRNYNGL